MFAGNDDLGILDDDFLQEVFHPVDPGRAGDGRGSATGGGPLHSTLRHAAVETSAGPCSVENQPIHLRGQKTSACQREASSKGQSMGQLAPDGGEDEFDDFFFDLPELEEDTALSTPPDSHFTQCSRLPSQADSIVSSVVKKDSDFRAKILKVLESEKSRTTAASKVDSGVRTEELGESDNPPPPEAHERGTSNCPAGRQTVPSNLSFQSERTRCQGRESTSVINGLRSHGNSQARAQLAKGEGYSVNKQQPSSTPVKRSVPYKRKTMSPGGPLVQKRKFPGPAGILPQVETTWCVTDVQETEDQPLPLSSQPVVCSQASADNFSTGPWQQMMQDLEMDASDPNCPLHAFNLKWVVRRASLRGPASVRRIPFLAVKVHTLDATHAHPTVVLKDPTGEINGTIASSVLEEFGDALQPGSVLLLRGVTVLSPSLREHLSRRHYLNITLNTVLTIYTPKDVDSVLTTTVMDIDRRELHREVVSSKMAYGPRAIVEEEEEDEEGRKDTLKESRAQNTSLFSSISSPLQRPSVNGPPQSSNFRAPRPMNNCPRPSPRFPCQPPPQAARAPCPASGVRGVHPGPSQNRGGTSMKPRMTAPITQAPQNRGETDMKQRMIAPAAQGQARLQRPFPLPTITTSSSERIQKPGFNTSIFSSQAEEEEVNELLNGLDTDSLFGDF